MDPEDLLALAVQLVDQGAERGATLRILGSLAVIHHTQESGNLLQMLERVPTHDIDFMGYSAHMTQIDHMFRDLGYEPDRSVASRAGLRRLSRDRGLGLRRQLTDLDGNVHRRLRRGRHLVFRGPCDPAPPGREPRRSLRGDPDRIGHGPRRDTLSSIRPKTTARPNDDTGAGGSLPPNWQRREA